MLIEFASCLPALLAGILAALWAHLLISLSLFGSPTFSAAALGFARLCSTLC